MATNGLSRRAAILLTLGAAISASFVHAQVLSGDLTGSILDPSGAAIAGAEIKAQNTATGVESVMKSGATGGYRLSDLPAGDYTLAVSAPNFSPATVKGVAVTGSRTLTVNVTLQLGSVSSRVDVKADAEIDTTTPTIGFTFNDRYSGDLPVTSIGPGGLGVLNLSLLTAGVASNGGLQIGNGPSVGGTRPRANNFTVDGVDNNNRANTGALAAVPNDATQEFTLLQNQFGSEFGHSSGGQFNVLVKTGGNDLHGSLYEYMQNRKLNAIDELFANSGITGKPRFDSNRFGGTVGGPIRRNRLFYFANLEYSPTGEASTPGQILTPTSQGYSTLGNMSGLSATNLGVLKQYAAPAPAALADTTQYPVVEGVAIPVGILPIVAPAYLNNFNAVGSGDYYASANDQLRVRYLLNHTSQIDNSAVLPTFYAQARVISHLAGVTEYHTFSPSLINEARIAYTRFTNNTPAGDFHYPGLDAFPNIQIADLNGLQLGPDSGAPQFTGSNTYQLADNLTWTHGRHTVKTGFSAQQAIAPIRFSQNVRGDYLYSSLDLFLRDITPDQLADRTIGNPTYYGNQHEVEAYIADSFRASSRLTLDLGLRYVHDSVPLGEQEQQLNAIASVPGLLDFRAPKAQFWNFAPRVGFAWSPDASGHTSIRGGFGMAWDPLYDNIGVNSEPPEFAVDVNLTGSTAPNFLAKGGITGNPNAGPLTAADARAETANYIPDQKLPYTLDWNIGVQHVFAKDFTFETRYLGTRGVHLDMQTRPLSYTDVTAAHSLPTYLSRPSQAALNALTLTEDDLELTVPTLPQYAAAGFGNPTLTEYAPRGNSSYNALATQITKRYSKNLQFIGAWTWSHLIDDSTEEFFTTLLSPRRPQDSQDLRAERGNSALDHRHRITFSAVYEVPAPAGAGRALREVAGGWSIAPIYTWESPEWVTALSQVDSNENFDFFSDRAIVNPAGTAGTGSGYTPLTNSAGNVVAYLADNPNARYIAAGPGAYANGGRNTLPGRPIDNIDLSIVKDIQAGEKLRVRFSAQFFNLLNHPQFVPAFLNRVDNPLIPNNSGADFNYLTPGSATFNNPEAVFGSNPRNIYLTLKLLF
ncbi:MAG TPA: carboxypeptidase regulatory-like domain-containing protein [Bryobacteraceae bacterium]|nr:carboxypeptidase regulatory-like domain-containing protein [Bryobacteraceae bacterium]